MRKISHLLEYAGVLFLTRIFTLFNIETASTLFGFIMRLIGPLLPPSTVARKNITLAFPQHPKKEVDHILRDCWENIGRTLAELPHIPKLPLNSSSGAGWSVIGKHWLDEAKQSKRPIIFFSGHLGNWEIMPTALAQLGMPCASLYRAPNNPYVSEFLVKQRRKNTDLPDIPSFPKGAKGARAAMRYLSQGGYIGLLGDQKMNDGISAKLFGHSVMTAPAAAALAIKFNALIVTGYIRREGAARLVLEVCPPIDPRTFTLPSEPRLRSVQRITQLLNDRLQEWITHSPGHWLWLHRRWPKDMYR